MYKKCTKCKIVKSLDHFYRDVTHKTGFKPACKDCIKSYIRNKSLERIQEKYTYQDKLITIRESLEFLFKKVDNKKNKELIVKIIEETRI